VCSIFYIWYRRHCESDKRDYMSGELSSWILQEDSGRVLDILSVISASSLLEVGGYVCVWPGGFPVQAPLLPDAERDM
jgi:hypothetical protein